jgi:hypothetical protein
VGLGQLSPPLSATGLLCVVVSALVHGLVMLRGCSFVCFVHSFVAFLSSEFAQLTQHCERLHIRPSIVSIGAVVCRAFPQFDGISW